MLVARSHLAPYLALASVLFLGGEVTSYYFFSYQKKNTLKKSSSSTIEKKIKKRFDNTVKVL